MTTTPVSPANGLADVAKAALTQQVATANDLVRQITAATADTGNLVADIRTDESTADPTVKAFQEWLEKVQSAIENKTAEINEHIKANLMPSREDVDVDALKTQYNELRKVIREGLGWVKSIGGDISDVPDLKSLRGGSSSAAGGNGPRRPRVNDILVNGESIAQDVRNAKTGKVERKANFTFAAAAISKAADAKVEVSDLQSAAFEAAKTDDLKSLNGEPFSFNYNVGEGDKVKTFDVKVYPRSADDKADDKAETSEAE